MLELSRKLGRGVVLAPLADTAWRREPALALSVERGAPPGHVLCLLNLAPSLHVACCRMICHHNSVRGQIS